VGEVIVGATMSLDGFITDRNGDLGPLYPDMDAMRDAEDLQESIRNTGAVVMGRRAYDLADPVGFADYEYQVPIFVLTHRVPKDPLPGENERLRLRFATDGIESAIGQAKAAAGDRDVTVVGGASTAQQCMRAGLADRIDMYIAPLVLGEGLRFFEQGGPDPFRLETISAQQVRWSMPGMTLVRYRPRCINMRSAA